MFVFNHHCFCHDCIWLVILVVCLGIMVVENNKLGLVDNMHSYLFVVCPKVDAFAITFG
jgi:hypothetical protein